MQDVHTNGRKHLARTGTEALLGVAVEAPQDEYVLSAKDPLRILWRRLWVIVLVAVVLAGSAVFYSLKQDPTYQASIKILIGQKPSYLPNDAAAAGAAAGALQGEVQGLKELTPTMASAVDTRPVAEAVIQRLGSQMSPEALLERLNVSRDGETQFINVGYEGADPEETQETVNAVGDAFSEQVSQVSASSNAVTATVWERATLPSSPIGPDPMRNGVLALGLGGMLGIGLAFLLEHLDKRWRSPEEVEQVSGAPTFGVIPQYKVPRALSHKE